MTIGIGKSATVLSALIDHPVTISVPDISFTQFETTRDLLDEHYEHWSSCALMEYDGGFDGDSILIFSQQSVKRWIQIIAKAQFGTVEEVMPEMESDLLLEVGNIIINGCIGSIANLLNIEANFHLPNFFTRVGSGLFDDLLEKDKTDAFGVIISSNFVVEEEEINADLIITIKQASMKFVIDRLTGILTG